MSINSSDFEFESDNEDYDYRGLNFDALPFGGNLTTTKRGNLNLFNNNFPTRTRVYKYPCLVCQCAVKTKTAFVVRCVMSGYI